jgi:hypothetical protein
MKYYIFMYENGIMRPVETVLKKRWRGDKGERHDDYWFK